MIHQLLFKLSICTVLLLVASCAAIKEKTVTEPAGWSIEQQKRQQINAWDIRGRLGIQTENDGGTLDVIWTQSEQDFLIRFIAPLGGGNYLIQGDSSHAEIRFPDGEKKTINDVDNIFSKVLEVELPAHAVKDWVRGLPASTLPVEAISWNEQGLLNTIKQSGWNVEMKKYAGEGVSMPHAIYLSRDDAVELDIRLLFRQWIIDK